jgi:hypothetical protein
MILQIVPPNSANDLIPIPAITGFRYTTIFPVAIWCIMLMAIPTGWSRKVESPDREVAEENHGGHSSSTN